MGFFSTYELIIELIHAYKIKEQSFKANSRGNRKRSGEFVIYLKTTS